MTATPSPKYRLAKTIEVHRHADDTVSLAIDGQVLPYFTCADEPFAIGIGQMVSSVGVVFLAEHVVVVDDIAGTTSAAEDLTQHQHDEVPAASDDTTP